MAQGVTYVTCFKLRFQAPIEELRKAMYTLIQNLQAQAKLARWILHHNV